MRPAFIVVEGLEGAGKSSVISLIQAFLQAQGQQCECTREPGGTPMAEAIRECVKGHWDEQVTQETELLLMYAARSQLVVNKIQPALKMGQFVIGDRHDMSSQAYQGGGRGVPMQTLAQLRTMTLQDFKPDLTLYLDVDPATGLQRASTRGELDRIELAGLAFFERTRAMYQNLVQADEHAVSIDAMQAMHKVHEDVQQALETWFTQWQHNSGGN